MQKKLTKSTLKDDKAKMVFYKRQ